MIANSRWTRAVDSESRSAIASEYETEIHSLEVDMTVENEEKVRETSNFARQRREYNSS